MIRLTRLVSSPNYHWRGVQYAVKRFCSNNSNDSVLPPSKSVAEKWDTSVEKTTAFPLGKTVDYRRMTNAENSAKVIELIEALPSNPHEVTIGDVMNFFDNIKGNYLITTDVVRHPKFDLIRQYTEVFLLQFNTKELQNMLISILPSKALMNDKISEMIVNGLLKRINHLPFEQVLFISFILHKYYRIYELGKDYICLRLSLQRSFLSQIDDKLDDLDDFETLMKIVAFCNNNVEVITPKIANLIATSLLLIDDDEKFDANHITSCLNLLSSMGTLNEHLKKLLHKMVDLWCDLDVTAVDVRTLLKILSANRDIIDKEQLKETRLIRHCVNVVTSDKSRTDRKLLFSIQNEFNRLDFTSSGLIEYLSEYFNENVQQFTLKDYIIFCKACAKAEYKPVNWESNVYPALKTFKFGLHLDKLSDFNWAEFVFDLDNLGHRDARLIQKILNRKSFRSSSWYNQENIEKLKGILSQCDPAATNIAEVWDSESFDSDDEMATPDSPLYKDLSNMFGSNKICTNVCIEGNFTIPYVLKMDWQSGEFLPITEVQSLPPSISGNEVLIGIVPVPSSKTGRTEQNSLKHAKKWASRLQQNVDIGTIVLDENQWIGLKAYEKALVFYTKLVNTLVIHRKNKLKQLTKDSRT